MTEQTTNLSERGVRRRRTMGIIWLAISIVAAGSMILLNSARSWRLVLFVPFAFAAVGFLQARERTCVALGMAGKRENPDGTYSNVPTAECPAIDRKVRSIMVRVVLIAVAATALIWSI